MNFFKKKLAEDQVSEDFQEAKRKLVEHETLLNYHQAMTDFYRQSLLRFDKYTEKGIK
jgi:hypothetical protein